MRIPPNAIIAPEKLTHYLLRHRVTGDKSKYLARAGFEVNTAALLEAEIRRVAAENDAIIERTNDHGIYDNVTGSIIGPSGIAVAVRFVWLHRLDGVIAFVTLIPESRSADGTQTL